MPVEAPESSQESTLSPNSELNALATPAEPELDRSSRRPPDEQYKEMAPTASVWKTCEDEGGKFDREMVADWGDGLDMLLVFVIASPMADCSYKTPFSSYGYAVLRTIQTKPCSAYPSASPDSLKDLEREAMDQEFPVVGERG
ncbi:hypothetical protein BDZ89DRAFT_1041423 [Hymenopellis radicata]|nr:hypothetical protein BDZ89DRAFT_1041423 [Hymenopellis radicata]